MWKGREQAGIPMADPAQVCPGISAVKALGLLPTTSRLQPRRCWGDISLGCAMVAGGGSEWDVMLSLGAAQLTAVPCQVPASLCIGNSRV